MRAFAHGSPILHKTFLKISFADVERTMVTESNVLFVKLTQAMYVDVNNRILSNIEEP